MIKSCHPEEESPQWLAGHLMFTLLLATLITYQASARPLNQGGQRGRINNIGALMMLLGEETLTGPNTMMAMTDMKESHGITTTRQITDQLEVLITEESLCGISTRLLVRISDLPSAVLGDSLGKSEFLVGSGVRRKLGQPKICAMY